MLLDYVVIVYRLCSTLASRKNLARVFAAAFVFFLLVEWGSHSLAFAHSQSEGMVAVSADGEHEDPCKTLVRCTDGRRQDQKVPNLGHDLSQHNAFLDRLSNSNRLDGIIADPRISRANVHELFRPVSPPFHPPELI